MTIREALMAEVDFLLDCAKSQTDLGLACTMALAAQQRLNAIKGAGSDERSVRVYGISIRDAER